MSSVDATQLCDVETANDQRISKYLFVAQLLRIIATPTVTDQPMYRMIKLVYKTVPIRGKTFFF